MMMNAWDRTHPKCNVTFPNKIFRWKIKFAPLYIELTVENTEIRKMFNPHLIPRFASYVTMVKRQNF